MKKHVSVKLKQAQDKLGLAFPDQLFDFISKLDKPEVKFGNDEWLFYSVTDNPKKINDNFVIERSKAFKNEWSLDGLVFATNGIGDYLLVLPNELGELVLIMMHEIAELRVFGKDIQSAFQNGPADYFWTDNYLYKLDDKNNLVKSDNFDISVSNKYSDDYFGEDYELRSRLDKMIDDEDTENVSDILLGLEKLSDCKVESHKDWALNKLSDIYFRGFGPVPRDLKKALDYNQQAINLNSYKALSNRAACHFYGIGMDKDLHKALELATKANEMSKSNIFADIISSKKGGGMYDSLVDMIKKEIEKQKNGNR